MLLVRASSLPRLVGGVRSSAASIRGRTRHAVRKQAGVEPERYAFFFFHELKLPEVYFSGLHLLHNGKRAKPLCGMVKVRNQFSTMGEMPKSLRLVMWGTVNAIKLVNKNTVAIGA